MDTTLCSCGSGTGDTAIFRIIGTSHWESNSNAYYSKNCLSFLQTRMEVENAGRGSSKLTFSAVEIYLVDTERVK